jgi:phosphatidylglycerol:prolipoprotein diacylglycerol transferase
MYPVLFSLGPVTFYTFGVFLFLGFFLAAFIIWRRLRDQGWPEEKILDFLFLATFGALIAGRIAFIINHFDLFGLSLGRFFLFTRYPGFSFWGGILGAILAMTSFIRKNRWDFWQVIDEVVFGLALFAVFYHLGCFFDGSKLGRETGAFWGVFFPGSLIRRQPVSLFEAMGYFLIWLFLWRIERRWRTWEWYKSHAEGLMSLCFFALAFLFSFKLAFLEDDRVYWLYFKQFSSLIFLMVTLILLYRRSGRKLKEDLKFNKRQK